MDTSFERGKNTKDKWLTPPHILAALGTFDLDPCSPINRPWDTASNHYTVNDNGLAMPWHGRVFCNPPYGAEAAAWLRKCAGHGNAIALTFARTETKMFFESVWNSADALLFIKGRLKFYHVTGEQGDSAGSPSVLIAYGEDNTKTLQQCDIEGKFVRLNQFRITSI